MSKPICSIHRCGKPALAPRGWCHMHYGRWQRNGDPLKLVIIKLPMPERFWAKVQKTDGCWIWQGRLTSGTGYGAFELNGKTRGAHRVAYELVKGAVPEGLELDHLCRNRACVNPDHLEPVTRRENIRRGANMILRSHCKHGHEFTPDNTHINGRGHQVCRACHRLRYARTHPRLEYHRSVGERNPSAKLTEDQVLTIRHLYDSGQVRSMRQLARQFNVNRVTIRHVIRRETWAHLVAGTRRLRAAMQREGGAE